MEGHHDAASDAYAHTIPLPFGIAGGVRLRSHDSGAGNDGIVGPMGLIGPMLSPAVTRAMES